LSGKIFSLENRVAVVTGAGRGIGFAIARTLAEAGATVVVAELNPELGQKAVLALADLGYQASFVPVNVADSEAVKWAAEQVISTQGRVDVLVNNAGICINADALETTDETWARQMEVNLSGVFYCCREFGRHMVEQRSGSIVNISSMAGVVDVRPQSHVAYSVSKAGVAHLARVLASEWAPHGVRVNAVGPGYVATDMPLAAGRNGGLMEAWMSNVPIGRMSEPEEISSVVLFLASDAASSVTGHLLMADGGYTVW
jgi:NAD(P)-dependent dehydrogenase (short-subunit alcohol dehydrogenase family)